TALREDAQRTLDDAVRDAEQIRKAAEVDSQHVAADRRREYQQLKDDVLAGAEAEAARIVADANGRAGGLALATHVKNGLAKPGTADSRVGPAKGGPAKGAPGAAKNTAKKRTGKVAEG